ncbi:MAG: uroporphyrinogen decarboxylase family protein [Thermoproteota archaeon]
MEPFSQDKYSSILEENRRRVEKAAQFTEPDRVPVIIGLGGPYYAKIFGYTFAEYYNNINIMLDAQVKGLKWRLKWLKDDLTEIGVHLDLGAVSEGIVFDCRIEMPDEGNPWLSPWIVPRIKTLEDIDRLEVPDPRRHKGIQDYYEKLEKFRQLVRRNYDGLPVGGWLQIHPPVSAAGSLTGPEKLYRWLYENPGEMHRLFRKLEEAFNVLQEYYYELSGSGPGSLGLADDHSGYLNRRMYEEFTLPYNLRLYERHGTNHRYLHMDSHMDHITDILVKVYRINEADVGVENNIKTIAEAFKGKVFFNGNADWRTLVAGSFEKIELEVEKCIFHAAPGGGYVFDNGGETYANVPPERLRYEVEYAKKVGRYPVRRENFKHLDKIKSSAC